MQTISILICDDHQLIRESWAFILDQDPRFKVIGLAGNAVEAFEKSKQFHPDVILMDISMRDISGFEATHQIRELLPDIKIIGLSGHSEPIYAKKMIQSGGSGYLTKNSPREEMFKAITEVVNGRKYFCQEVKENLSQEELSGHKPGNALSTLSKRELEVLNFVAKGFTSNEVAEQLKVSKKTVEVHRYNAMKKLNLGNAASLINYLNKHQLKTVVLFLMNVCLLNGACLVSHL